MRLTCCCAANISSSRVNTFHRNAPAISEQSKLKTQGTSAATAGAARIKVAQAAFGEPYSAARPATGVSEAGFGPCRGIAARAGCGQAFDASV